MQIDGFPNEEVSFDLLRFFSQGCKSVVSIGD